MEKFSLSGPDEELQEWKAEADELGITQSRYGRERIRAARLLWEVDEFKVENLTKLLDQENQAESGGTRSVGQKSGLPQATVNQDLGEIVLRELPKDGAREPLELAEIRELVFGSEAEQEDAVIEALEELNNQGKAKRTVKGGFVKTDTDNE